MEKAENRPGMPGISPESECGDCVHYDCDDETGEYFCNLQLDEDEMADFIMNRRPRCPYYRFYDEYKSVQKQN